MVKKKNTPSKRAVAAEGPPNPWTRCLIHRLPLPQCSAQPNVISDLFAHRALKHIVFCRELVPCAN
ncbi:hypothetical protein C1H46_037399 [Malus baccata]|uniref:Uncharacterized protein n=1 Tax=Malus baccata TaxID=106549 RepID=A0A540KST1_MALBA|nr:hypothetical protein C1H46_037399 [Malus baccata]